jgi:hypothetical protein
MAARTGISEADFCEKIFDFSERKETLNSYEEPVSSQDENVIPDFFENHIEFFNSIPNKPLSPKKEESKSLAIIEQFEISRARLYKIMTKFNKMMIVERFFKSCTCNACIKMMFPILIKYNTTPSAFFQKHNDHQQKFLFSFDKLDPSQPMKLQIMIKLILNQVKPDALI